MDNSNTTLSSKDKDTQEICVCGFYQEEVNAFYRILENKIESKAFETQNVVLVKKNLKSTNELFRTVFDKLVLVSSSAERGNILGENGQLTKVYRSAEKYSVDDDLIVCMVTQNPNTDLLYTTTVENCTFSQPKLKKLAEDRRFLICSPDSLTVIHEGNLKTFVEQKVQKKLENKVCVSGYNEKAVNMVHKFLISNTIEHLTSIISSQSCPINKSLRIREPCICIMDEHCNVPIANTIFIVEELKNGHDGIELTCRKHYDKFRGKTRPCENSDGERTFDEGGHLTTTQQVNHSSERATGQGKVKPSKAETTGETTQSKENTMGPMKVSKSEVDEFLCILSDEQPHSDEDNLGRTQDEHSDQEGQSIKPDSTTASRIGHDMYLYMSKCETEVVWEEEEFQIHKFDPPFSRFKNTMYMICAAGFECSQLGFHRIVIGSPEDILSNFKIVENLMIFTTKQLEDVYAKQEKGHNSKTTDSHELHKSNFERFSGWIKNKISSVECSKTSSSVDYKMDNHIDQGHGAQDKTTRSSAGLTKEKSVAPEQKGTHQ